MAVRLATNADLPKLYQLGLATPEIQVSATEPFMDEDEFLGALKKKENFFVLWEEMGEIVGFIMADTRDQDIGYHNKYGCIIYVVVKPEFRGKGVAKKLYAETERIMKERGMTNLYCWASMESPEIQKFMKKQGFAEGHRYVWMDKKL